jgi:hypothetical protein
MLVVSHAAWCRELCPLNEKLFNSLQVTENVEVEVAKRHWAAA